MAKEQKFNEYKVTVTSKYEDFDGTERESRKSKVVLAKTEAGAIAQVTKQAKKIVTEVAKDKTTEKWNDRASQFVTNQDVKCELLKEGIWVMV